LRLPLAEKVVVGRFNGNPDEVQPDVDLAPLGAGEAGVSRRHLQITYRNGGVYAADLGSSNGTWLNGIRVFAHSERLLRSGDELRLGTLKVYITF
jgi:pSer/pThr/pTyr-binding forkhead associated (FHA) protein